MIVADLKDKNVVIWGTGREGIAAAAFLRRTFPDMSPTFVDEATDTPAAIAATLDKADVIIKSPGVSLYHPLIQKALSKGTPVTSLLNLWLAEPRSATVIAVTGTKGKSTTSALMAHTLNALGHKTALVGNIGIPVTEAPDNGADYIVIEVSSYQAATFDGVCPIGVLTSLYPEHLDWHQSLDAYYRDKLNLLTHSRAKIINADALATLRQHNIRLDKAVTFDNTGFSGQIVNPYLSRPVNLTNVCAVMTVLKYLGIAPVQALPAMNDFKGLPHRQQELGERNGILYVDDSIATTPQSAIAALESYKEKPVTLIAGGFDRGIDTAPLVDYIVTHKIHAVITMGPSGQRIAEQLTINNYISTHHANTMRDAVAQAQKLTPKNGVVLLSPAAPSYDQFKNFEERGKCFAKECGFSSSQSAPSILKN